MATIPNGNSKILTVSLNNPSCITTNDDDFDGVKVEISDLDNSYPNATTLSLMRCKKQILHPFRQLLCLIGWRPFGADSLKRSSIMMRIVNIVYPICILLFLLYTYTYEIIVCQGKLNVVIDTRSTTTTTRPPSTTTIGDNYTVADWITVVSGRPIRTTNATTLQSHPECGHIFTTYILPDILHFMAFIIGFIYFRVTEGEQMYALMEKVFIHADQNMRQFSPNRVIRRLKYFMLIGGIWVLASMGTHALFIIIYGFNHPAIFGEKHFVTRKTLQYVLFILEIICLLISNCIHLAVVLNFVTHCEMIVFYCKAIRTRLEEKSINLIEAMKQILDVGSSISQLNSSASRMMSILILFFLERVVLGLFLLIFNRIDQPLVWTYRTLYPIVWLSILLFSFGQAARVTSKCDKFFRIGLSMRVYGYPTTSNSELDGFLLFLSQAELRAKLFALTVRPGKVIMILVAAMLLLVILIQTSIISSPNFFF